MRGRHALPLDKRPHIGFLPTGQCLRNPETPETMADATQTGIPFMKMHALGNDFLVVDSRAEGAWAGESLAAALSDRRRAVGFDQLAEILESHTHDARLRFFNSDGSYSGTCGNATRCIARYLMQEKGQSALTLETERGAHECADAGDGLTSVNMGQPVLDWRRIPLRHDVDTLSLPIDGEPTAVGMGNPHCVFFVPDAEEVEVEKIGPEIENHRLFPQRANVEFVSVLEDCAIRVRMWERGAGVTPASGSGACAAMVAAARRGLVRYKSGEVVDVRLDGGELKIAWARDGVWATGPTAHVYDGVLRPEFLETL